MITDNVIKEIYKKFKKPPRDKSELNLDYYMQLLRANHAISTDGMEVVIEDLDEFNPFRRFLVRAINAVLEFDKMIAFVFNNHILFLGKEDNQLRVHIRPEKPKSFMDRIFGR